MIDAKSIRFLEPWGVSSIAVIPEANFPEIFLPGDPLRQRLRGESLGVAD